MRDTILCLCDLTGVMARPWVEHGYHAVLVDPQHGVTSEDGAYLKLACTIVEAFDQIRGLVRSGRLAFVAGFPPCTDMAVSGAQWFPPQVRGRPFVSGEGRIRSGAVPGDR